MIPPSRLDVVGRNVASNGPGDFDNYTSTVNRSVRDHSFTVRVDHRASARDSFFVRFAYEKYKLDAPQGQAALADSSPGICLRFSRRFQGEEGMLHVLRRRLGRACQRGGLAGFALAAGVSAPAASDPSPSPADDTVALSIDASKPGAKIDRNIFGQFAEHLGTGIYEGVWVGPDSPIPNTRGLRNDVVAALKALKVPNVRWPGGCFADEYHWRNGIGLNRPATLNPNWGGVVEPNSFGTHEFMDFLDQIGSEAFISVNVGSGTPQEAADWFEYLTTDQPTALAKGRAANGRSAPYKIAYLGIGNESWDCGGNMTPATFVPVTFDAGTYTHGDVALPRVDAVAARDTAGTLWLTVINMDPNRPVTIAAAVAGVTARSAAGQTLTASRVDSVNTFEAPDTVVPKAIAAKVSGGTVTLTVDPKSVTVISVRP